MSEAVTPEAALALLAAHRGPVIVDFDETLYLRNSTEAFLEHARPRIAAAIALRLLDFCAPWRWRGGVAARDFWRLRLILALSPGTAGRWQRSCGAAAAAYGNHRLIAALRASGQPVAIASAGFAPVIAPLAGALGCGGWKLIACSLASSADRRTGKRVMTEGALGGEMLAAALVITDSAEDAALFRDCAGICLARWPGAKFERAFASLYLPGDYLAYVKRPGVPHVLRLLVTDDLIWWLLMALTAAGTSLPELAGVALLFPGFWAVYETGYAENDRCAVAREADPMVTPEFWDFEPRRFGRNAWAWAAALSAAGLELACPHGFWPAIQRWGLVLLGLRVFYAVYNRRAKPKRRWLYLPLQMFRSLSFGVVLPIAPLGLAAGLAQAVSRWLGYLAYRHAGGGKDFDWRGVPVRAVQALLLSSAVVALWLGGRRLGWPAAALLGWNVLLARAELMRLARRLWRVAARPNSLTIRK